MHFSPLDNHQVIVTNKYVLITRNGTKIPVNASAPPKYAILLEAWLWMKIPVNVSKLYALKNNVIGVWSGILLNVGAFNANKDYAMNMKDGMLKVVNVIENDF